MASKKGSKKGSKKRTAKRKSAKRKLKTPAAHKRAIKSLAVSVKVVNRRLKHLQDTGKQECGRGSKGQR